MLGHAAIELRSAPRLASTLSSVAACPAYDERSVTSDDRKENGVQRAISGYIGLYRGVPRETSAQLSNEVQLDVMACESLCIKIDKASADGRGVEVNGTGERNSGVGQKRTAARPPQSRRSMVQSGRTKILRSFAAHWPITCRCDGQAER